MLMLVTPMYLARENSEHDKEEHDPTYDNVYIVQKSETGTTEKVKVDKVGYTLCILESMLNVISKSFSTLRTCRTETFATFHDVLSDNAG